MWIVNGSFLQSYVIGTTGQNPTYRFFSMSTATDTAWIIFSKATDDCKQSAPTSLPQTKFSSQAVSSKPAQSKRHQWKSPLDFKKSKILLIF